MAVSVDLPLEAKRKYSFFIGSNFITDGEKASLIRFPKGHSLMTINTSNGILKFNVTGFSIYSSEETPTTETPSTSTSGGGGGGGGVEIIKDFSRIEFHFDFHLADPDDIEGLLISGAKLIYPKR